MPTAYPYHLTDKTLTVFVGGKPLQADRSNPKWEQIKAALNDPDTEPDYLTGLMTPIQRIADAVKNDTLITVRDGMIFYGDEVVDNVLSAKMVDIIDEGLDIEPWRKFAQNCYDNPSTFARDELYVFLEKAQLPITPDGCFIAYKRVRADYTDLYSGRMDNSVGKVVIMPGGRSSVDANRNRTCSNGLHFCSKGYLDHFGGPILLLVKINPADVVSIPADYNDSKGRCWRFEVVDVVDDRTAREKVWPAVSAGHNEKWGYDADEEDALAALDAAPLALPEPIVVPVEAKAVKVEEPVVQTVTHGPIDLAKFQKLVKKHGSPAGVARALGKSAGTIQTWKVKLGYVAE